MRSLRFRGRADPKMFDMPWQYGFLVVHEHAFGVQYEIHTERGTVVVDPDTVGQLTGLQDKNGKDVYEGDFLAIRPKRKPPKDAPTRFRVEWNEKGFCYNAVYFWNGEVKTDLAVYVNCVLPEFDCEIEVIGNIHE